ncbi:MAG: twin-arginine translocation signal domain-containing protein, partial [Planctomycetaceae bacterium]|nr:twin-arginine translocation signal domain-containing protein [Planctomycetaceae bacterium]
MQSLTRRQFLTTASIGTVGLLGLNNLQAERSVEPELTLGFSLYGMPHM